MTSRNTFLLISHTRLDNILAIFPELSGIFDTKSMFKDLGDFLKRKTRDFRVEEDYENPADPTDSSVEAKSTRGSHSFHHGQDGRGNNDVASLATAGHEHGIIKERNVAREVAQV